jgi:hypothetical protein
MTAKLDCYSAINPVFEGVTTVVLSTAAYAVRTPTADASIKTVISNGGIYTWRTSSSVYVRRKRLTTTHKSKLPEFCVTCRTPTHSN